MRYLTLLAVFAAGCTGNRDSSVDAAAAPIDAAAAPIDGSDSLDADPNLTCDPSRTYNWVAQRPIEPGDFCDDLQLCADDAEIAAAVMAAVPGFECEAAAGQGGCTAGQLFCHWNSPDVLDADEWAGLCEITVLEEPPMIRCFVYL